MSVGIKQLLKLALLLALVLLAFAVKEFFFDPQIIEIGSEWVSFPEGRFILYSYSIDGEVQNIYLRSEEEVNEYRTYLDRVGRFVVEKKKEKK